MSQTFDVLWEFAGLAGLQHIAVGLDCMSDIGDWGFAAAAESQIHGHHMFGPSSLASQSAWVAYRVRCQVAVLAGEATSAQSGVAAVAPLYGVVVVAESSCVPAGQVETWEEEEVHIVLEVLPPKHVFDLVDTWRALALGAAIHAKDYFARRKAMVEEVQRSQPVVVEQAGDSL
jgi:hypothetical protein